MFSIRNEKESHRPLMGLEAWFMLAFCILSGAVGFGEYAGSTLRAQTIVKGRVIDSETREPILGASVRIEGTQDGTTTNDQGQFEVTTMRREPGTLVVSMVGFVTLRKEVPLRPTGGELNLQPLGLQVATVGLREAQVIASVALDRATPVALSTVDVREIEARQGDRELVETLNITPGVYATKSGGGFGDSRINIRGFDQRNVAVLINGIPVNDMENGWVYWSNWAGLGDAVATIQVQRGLGASKLAINSVGGTLNMVTRGADVQRSVSIGQTLTDYGRYKTLLSLHSGRLRNGWAVSAVGSRTSGNAYVDATFVDAWSYFLSASRDFGEHRWVFTVIGAPQTHGQRRGALTVERYQDLEQLGYEAHRWNDDWGYRDGGVQSARVNHYHKPQFAVNHYAPLGHRGHWASSLYVSLGRGYGTRLDGTTVPRLTETYGPDGAQRTIRTTLDWDYLVSLNEGNTQAVTYLADEIAFDPNTGAWSDTLHRKGDPVLEGGVPVTGMSRSSIERQHNDHFWTGLLSTMRLELGERTELLAGVDVRAYEGRHYTTVEDLLGGQFVRQAFAAADGYGVNPDYALLAREGDVIKYDDRGQVAYGGGFGQIEYKSPRFSAFAAGTLSHTLYRRLDRYKYFRYESTGVQPVAVWDAGSNTWTQEEAFRYGIESERAGSTGYNFKAGGSFLWTEASTFYLHAGQYARAPFIQYVFTNFSNALSNDRLVTEKVRAVEWGYRFRRSQFSVDFNAYHTQWRDKSIISGLILRPDGTVYRAFITGLVQIHDGLELEWRWRPARNWTVGGMASVGNWRWDNDVEADINDEATGEVIESLYIYSAGLKVSDAPQTQVGVLAEYRNERGWAWGASYVYNTRLYARFQVDLDRTAPERAGLQPVALPDYGYLDVNVGKDFVLRGARCRLQANVQNALDHIYMSDGFETFYTDPQTGTKLQGTVENGKLEGYWSYGRTVALTWRVAF